MSSDHDDSSDDAIIDHVDARIRQAKIARMTKKILAPFNHSNHRAMYWMKFIDLFRNEESLPVRQQINGAVKSLSLTPANLAGILRTIPKWQVSPI